MSTPTEDTIQGFKVVGLGSDAVDIRVIPALGAKILSLVDRRTGREWMWRPPGDLKLFANRTGDSFLDSTLVGADECVPTVLDCIWKGRNLTDHGEAWTEAWNYDSGGDAIVTRLVLPISPFTIQRTVTVDDATVTLDYELTNTGDEPEEYVWALHPMMTIRPGERLALPAEVDEVRSDTAINFEHSGRGDRWRWPGSGWDRVDAIERGDAVKLFTAPLREGWAEIRHEDTGEGIRYDWDTGELNTLGVWINRGGWDGYHHVAIEPTHGAPDPLDLAVRKWKRHATLAPGASTAWTVRITLL